MCRSLWLGPRHLQSSCHFRRRNLTPSSTSCVAPEQRGGATSLRRRGILAILPTGCIVVLDCVVTHSAATSYASLQLHVFVAAKAETRKRSAFTHLSVTRATNSYYWLVSVSECVTAKRKDRRKAKEKTRKETRKGGEHLD